MRRGSPDLGKRYGGTQVSRHYLHDDNDLTRDHGPAFDDPDTVDLNAPSVDGDISSDDAFTKSDDETERYKNFKLPASTAKPNTPSEPYVNPLTLPASQMPAEFDWPGSSNPDMRAHKAEMRRWREEERLANEAESARRKALGLSSPYPAFGEMAQSDLESEEDVLDDTEIANSDETKSVDGGEKHVEKVEPPSLSATESEKEEETSAISGDDSDDADIISPEDEVDSLPSDEDGEDDDLDDGSDDDEGDDDSDDGEKGKQISKTSKSAALKRLMGTDGKISDEDDSDDEGAPVSKRNELKSLMSSKAAAQSVTTAQVADKEKGLAVRQQRKVFDSLLNVRIRIQKGLVATNSMTAIDDDDVDIETSEPYEAAEEAAIKLFNQLTAMRHTLDKADGVKTSSKRKRDVDMQTESEDIWDRLQQSEVPAIAKRQTTLEFWSNKIKGAQAAPLTGQVKGKSASLTITQVLEDQLSNSEHLIKRTRTPRSCAPLQLEAKILEDENIYDDADFYQQLLEELVDQRMVDSSSTTATGVDDTVTSWTAVKEAKTRKNVDTKASKGRKMKFTVHEKLQNFMAPEDRTTWEQDACDRFFGSLFGQKLDLAEDESVSDEEMTVPDGGLKLF